MVELPRYVHRIIKRRKGKDPVEYYFYTRHRNTPEAWPSIGVPHPLTREFQDAISICGHLEREDDGWKLHGAALPDHKAEDFWLTAQKVHAAWHRRQHEDAKDFTALVDQFNDDSNPTWAKLAKSTRLNYRRSGEMIKAAWAFDLPSELTAVDAQQAIDALADTPATANQFRAYLSRLMAWGVPRGFSTSNPVQFTDKIPGGEPWTPWPDWAFDVLFEHAPFNMLMPAISALFTGQRQTDVLGMERPKLGEGVIAVTAQKTKTTVWVPIHSGYRPWLQRAEAMYAAANEARVAADKPAIVSKALHLGVKGHPYKAADGFRTEWQKMMDTPPFHRFREERIVFHGLRKNAVINLLEVGCTEAEVGSITNMSPKMVQHYGKDVSKRRLAVNAMKRLEENWDSVAPRFLEQEQNANWKPATRIGNRWAKSYREK
ncbi:hypothetical protein NO932_11840 [Pelagibacterium sp. 26DY04]|uniref:hypothetical protein n=1 Tax=Pelagibacterium sp. 26DY04 TaxID=2967130 RepID=UPI002815B2BF|nr:hypothetical protein [Pelagibacterium sp. 26DY04]WMT85620.1 hypothetical protein NO932_11840 [Pelagibacterium sp. 26DY04]